MVSLANSGRPGSPVSAVCEANDYHYHHDPRHHHRYYQHRHYQYVN